MRSVIISNGNSYRRPDYEAPPGLVLRIYWQSPAIAWSIKIRQRAGRRPKDNRSRQGMKLSGEASGPGAAPPAMEAMASIVAGGAALAMKAAIRQGTGVT